MAVASRSIPHVDIVVVVARRDGAGLPSARLTQIAQRSCHLPSVQATNCHLSEMSTNLGLSFPVADVDSVADQNAEIPVSMFVDKLKIQEHLWWDPQTNMILSVCHEHDSLVSLDFRSMAQADATVVAIYVLNERSRQNQAQPFIISGTCKHETVAAQQKLIEGAVTSIKDHLNFQRARLYYPIPPNSPLHFHLACLPLFNILCGMDELTADIDFKHVLKQFRNTLLRQKGVTIDNVMLNTAILKTHLADISLSAQCIDSFLFPNDRQNVPLAYALLLTIASLPDAASGDTPAHHAARRVLCILGAICRYLLEAYTNIYLSLGEQLGHLSAVLHLLLALYEAYKGGFILVQLYFDTATMIKNIFFSTAKVQAANPNGKFWIILLGTDALELLFGIIRTMIGNDTNPDHLQLASQISKARCLTLPAGGLISAATSEVGISKIFDHIGPAMWKGNVNLSNVQGRKMTAENLIAYGLHVPFDEMDARQGLDILCPFGNLLGVGRC
ncbi:hypothetical protein BKA93DRAFT_820570 [Sparassis latifolia]